MCCTVSCKLTEKGNMLFLENNGFKLAVATCSRLLVSAVVYHLSIASFSLFYVFNATFL